MKDGAAVVGAPGSVPAATESWNVEVFIDVIKDLVSITSVCNVF